MILIPISCTIREPYFNSVAVTPLSYNIDSLAQVFFVSVIQFNVGPIIRQMVRIPLQIFTPRCVVYTK